MRSVWLMNSIRALLHYRALVLALLLSTGLGGCRHHSAATNYPDRAIFDRGILAVRQKKFEVARLTFQTLINTYPDSKYARKSLAVMKDPRVGGCSRAWFNPPCTGYSHGSSR